jgi:uncharacterized protein (UPF0147 family)
MSTEKQVEDIIKALDDLSEDTAIPKNIKLKIQNITNTLKEKTDVSIKVSKALGELDEIADDANMEPYIRTQIWSIVSHLEKIA